ncbi:calcium uniporter protein 4, mitochondrial-like [Primulina eburnea]|uniref:calcium uniporter protein 4, mitochondrial-like n=1 Tax=Primulina eburnea TaxID=1245227 RepID=UPI003C6C8752
MAFRLTLSKRLLRTADRRRPSFPIPAAEDSPIPPQHLTGSTPANDTSKPQHFHLDFLTSSPDSASSGLSRRFLQRRDINNHSSADGLPSFLSLTVGEKLREKLKSLNVIGDHRLRLEGLSPPPPVLPPPQLPAASGLGVDVADVKRILRCLQLERVRERLRNIPASTIPYMELVGICGEVCGNSESGVECAKSLDQSGNVIVLGGLVFLRPNEVTKSMEKLISESVGTPNDPRREELDGLEVQKAQIDRKAEALVRFELYFGLGYLVLQTLGFMRLTFWELSWDVMEPICFFVTSLHFAMAYLFFMRTSTEPSFLGYFQRRFNVKQKKLMKIQNFDIERYNHLSRVFYPDKSFIDSRDRAFGKF